MEEEISTGEVRVTKAGRILKLWSYDGCAKLEEGFCV